MPLWIQPLIWAAIFMSCHPSFAGPTEKGCEPRSGLERCA